MWEFDYKESWALKNWCFWTVVLEKTLESPLDCKEIQPLNTKRNQPEYSLEGLMLKPKLQYFGHLMQRIDSFEKTLMLGKIEGRRKRGRQRMRWMPSLTWWTWVWESSRSWWWTGKPGVIQFTESQRVRHDWVNEMNWTDFQRRHLDSQQVYEKTVNITNQGSSNQNQSEISPHIYQNGYY